MDDSQKHYAKWKKPDKRLTHYIILFTWNSRKGKTTHMHKHAERERERESKSSGFQGTVIYAKGA